MRAGPLRHRADLLELQRVPDGGGGYSEQWVFLRKVCCDGSRRLTAATYPGEWRRLPT